MTPPLVLFLYGLISGLILAGLSSYLLFRRSLAYMQATRTLDRTFDEGARQAFDAVLAHFGGQRSRGWTWTADAVVQVVRGIQNGNVRDVYAEMEPPQ